MAARRVLLRTRTQIPKPKEFPTMGLSIRRFVTASLVLLIVTGSGSMAKAAFPGANGKIAFVSTRDGLDEIYTMNPDGSGVVRLTNNFYPDNWPTWSADGAQIAFQRTVSSNTDIYKMSSTGADQVNLTNDPADDDYPAWSPDGTRIVFASLRDGTGEDLFAMNADGSAVVQLTFETSANDFDPAWSPDGTRIVFVQNANGTYHLWEMNSDGSGKRQVTNKSLIEDFPDWSPDGSHLVLNRCNMHGMCTVEASRANGRNERTLTTGPLDLYPVWSPDGSLIAFARSFDIFTMNTDGTGLINISNNAAIDQQPAWQPIP
jgi:Tol biopolymer transport system component